MTSQKRNSVASKTFAIVVASLFLATGVTSAGAPALASDSPIEATATSAPANHAPALGASAHVVQTPADDATALQTPQRAALYLDVMFDDRTLVVGQPVRVNASVRALQPLDGLTVTLRVAGVGSVVTPDEHGPFTLPSGERVRTTSWLVPAAPTAWSLVVRAAATVAGEPVERHETFVADPEDGRLRHVPHASAAPGLDSVALRGHKVVMVHGFDPRYISDGSGIDVGATFEALEDNLIDYGWPADMGHYVGVGFYQCDFNHDLDASRFGAIYVPAGEHSVHTSGDGDANMVSSHSGSQMGCPAPGHDIETPIQHVAYHVAWALYFGLDLQSGACVNLLGYSMGSLVVRYMVARVEEGHPDFPPKASFCAAAAVTLGGPHAGTKTATSGLCGAFSTYQCEQQRPDSAFVAWLGQHARHPDGAGGTYWVPMGSDADDVVSGPSGSGSNMDADRKVIFRDVEHSGGETMWMNAMNTAASAVLRVADAPAHVASAPDVGNGWVGRWVDRSLAMPGWACGTDATSDHRWPILSARTYPGEVFGHLENGVWRVDQSMCRYVVDKPEAGNRAVVEVRGTGSEALSVWVPSSSADCYAAPSAGNHACVFKGTLDSTYAIDVEHHSGDVTPFTLRAEVYQDNDCGTDSDAGDSGSARLIIPEGPCQGHFHAGAFDALDAYRLDVASARDLSWVVTPATGLTVHACIFVPGDEDTASGPCETVPGGSSQTLSTYVAAGGAVGLHVTPLSGAGSYTFTTATTGSGPVTLQNGGDGPHWDANLFRGKLFQSGVPQGTLTEVCAYGEGGGTTEVAVKPTADAADPTITVPMSFATTGWNCEAVSTPWTANTLFMYKASGGARIGYDRNEPSDSRYSTDNGVTWLSDPTSVRRGYRATIDTSSGESEWLENGGTGPGFDHNSDRGKYFSSGVPTGSLAEVCVYARGADGDTVVGVKETPNGPLLFDVSVATTQDEGWHCAETEHDWTAASLFVYKRAGSASIGYDDEATFDSWYWNAGENAWVQDDHRRGFRARVVQGTVQTWLENGGESATSFDVNDLRGKHFSSGVPASSIAQVCVWGDITGRSVVLGLKESPDAAPDVQTVQLTIEHDAAWTCVNTAVSWSAPSLFVYKKSGNGGIGWDLSTPHDSYHSNDNGATWQADEVKRGFKVLLTTDQAPVTLVNGGEGPGFDQNNYRGKLFTDGVRAGVVTEICVFGKTQGSNVQVAVKADANGAAAAFTTTVSLTTSEGWSCVDVDEAWSAPSLFIYKIGGTGRVGWDDEAPYDSRYSLDGGTTWQSDAVRRGYKVTIA